MKSFTSFLILQTFFCISPSFSQPFSYPTPQKDSNTTNYFGTVVADPYRWMENVQSLALKDWATAENELSKNYLEKLKRKYSIDVQLDDNSHFSFGTIFKSGKYFFDRIRIAGSPSAHLYIKQRFKDTPEEIVDPADYKKNESDVVGIEEFEVSGDNKYLAFSLSHNGSDWREIRVKYLPSFRSEKDIIKWVKFSEIKWVGSGFYYCRYPESYSDNSLTEALYGKAVYYHRLGTNQSEDKLVFNDPVNSRTTLMTDVIGNERYLIIYSGNKILYYDLKDSLQKEPIQLMKSLGGGYNILGVYKSKFLASTTNNAARGKVVLIDPKTPDTSVDFIKQYKNVLRRGSIVGSKVVCLYQTDIDWSCVTFDSSGSIVNLIKFPSGCAVEGAQRNPNGNTTLISYYSPLHPLVAYEYDVDKLKTSLLQETYVQYDAHSVEIKKVFYTSKDGEQIPMIIALKKGLKRDKNTPTILYGYGGFGLSHASSFNVGFINHILDGGIIALPCLRGGGEYGEDWHNKGRLFNKQNTFNDFIAAAEYLVDSGYTRKEKLAIMGGSNGGLLVGAVITQRPDLCKVAVSKSGVFDMLRYHLYTIGSAWKSEYGSSLNQEQFNYIYKYSPLHNVREAAYPATLVVIGDHDDRVVPMHSYKFVATLQEKNKGSNPILLVTQKNTGHFVGGNDMDALIYSFIYEQLGVKPHELSN